jgi:hypothetical protein
MSTPLRSLRARTRPGSRGALIAVLIALALLAVPAASLVRQWGGTIYWETDALFYQAKLLQVRGMSQDAAVERVFEGPMSSRARSLDADEPGEPHRVTRPEWVDYSTQFYERRWLLPLAGAGLWPVLGEHSLETLSLIGYCLLCPMLFLLLRRRFSTPISFGVALAAMALPPLRDWTLYPLTDSWGLVFLAGGVLAALAVLERGPRWLPLWMLCVAALAFTRDTAFLLLAAAGVMLLLDRNRRSALLAGTGVLAALPAPLLWGAPVKELLAYLLSDIDIPQEVSWSFIASEYLPRLGEAADGYIDFVARRPLVTLVFLIGIASLFVLAPKGDRYFNLLRGTLLGYVVFLAIGPTFSNFRYELVLIPAVATGWGLVAERVQRELVARGRLRSVHTEPEPEAART